MSLTAFERLFDKASSFIFLALGLALGGATLLVGG